MLLPVLTAYEKEHISERQPLPERYLGLSDEEMDRRIAAARATLGRRLVILGHHYQRDEVIKFADYTGDSYKLAGEIAKHPDAEFIVFCGVHFMAESADVLSAPHQQVILADLAEPEQLEMCWADLEEMGIAVPAAGGSGLSSVVPVTYINSAASIKAFVVERRGDVEVGVATRRACPLSARPAPGPQHRVPDGRAARRDGRLGSERDLRRSRSGCRQARAHRALERSLFGSYPLHRAPDRTPSCAASRHLCDRAPRGAVGRRPGCRRFRVHRIHHQNGEAQPGGVDLGRWYRDSPRQPARARSGARADRHVDRSVWLPLLDDVPRLAQPSAVDARRPRCRRGS